MLANETWMLTGAAGQVASGLRPELAARVARLRLVDTMPVQLASSAEESVVADVCDQEAITRAMAGVDGVLHLGGLADEADFHDLAEVNVVGTFHVLEAARRASVRRVVYASSNRITGFYPTDARVASHMPPRPDGLYGVCKVAGEALGRLYADKFGLEIVSVRIGSLEQRPLDARQLSTWLSPADCQAAFLAAMTAPDVTYAAFYAVSRNTRGWWDLSAGERLGFEPQDDAERYAAVVGADAPINEGAPQGGIYATPAYTLDRQRA